MTETSLVAQAVKTNDCFYLRKNITEQETSMCVHARSVAKSDPTLCNLTDCSPPGSSDNRIFQARILEWVAIS